MNTSHTKLELPLFHASYDLFIGPASKPIQEHIGETFPTLNYTLPANATGHTSLIDCPVAGKGVIVVLNTFMSDDIEVDDTIHHEAVHVSWMILNALGIKITYDNHEIQAYLLEHVIKDIKNAYKEYCEKKIDIEDLPDL